MYYSTAPTHDWIQEALHHLGSRRYDSSHQGKFIYNFVLFLKGKTKFKKCKKNSILFEKNPILLEVELSHFPKNVFHDSYVISKNFPLAEKK